MKQRKSLFDYLSENSEDEESIPFCPIVEVAGTQRVLIENHYGVMQYSCETVGVRVNYGKILVLGSGLSLKHMTKRKLIIAGQIEQIHLIRGNIV